MADPSVAPTVPNETDNRIPPELSGNGNGSKRIEPVGPGHIEVDVGDRMFRTLKRRIFPTEIEGILWQASTGDLYWQEQLWSTMVDTWYRLSTNLRKLRLEVQAFDYEVAPWSPKNKKPSPRAIEKADFVEQALFGMSGNIAWQEHGFFETVGALVESLVSGFMVLEVDWEARSGLGIVPKCTRWCPARYYRYPYKMSAIDRLMLNPSGMLGSTTLMDFPIGQFIISVQQSHINFPVFTAPFRPLLGWWVAGKFGLEWLMQYAQIFGFPQRIGYYEQGDDKVYAELVRLMKASQAATWGVFPKGTEIEMQSPPGGTGATPHDRLVEDADKACDIMLLGQTLTTDVAQSGSRALGAVHKSVFEQIVESSAKLVAGLITKHLVPSIIQQNFGDLQELPELRPSIHTPIDLVQLSTAYNVLFGPNGMRIPISKKQLYETLQITPPEPGDELYETPAPTPKPGFGGFGAGGGGHGPGEGGGPPGGIPDGKGGLPEDQLSSGAEEKTALGEQVEGANPHRGEGGRFTSREKALYRVGDRGKKIHKALPEIKDRFPQEAQAANALEQYFVDNADYISGIRWHSVMDDRTTAQCVHLDGKRWTYPQLNPIGHSTAFPGFPPIFYNCRSHVVPVIKAFGRAVKVAEPEPVAAEEGEGHRGNPYHDEQGRFTSHEEAASGPAGQEKPEEDLKKKPTRIGKRITTAQEALNEAKKVTRIQDKLEKSQAEAKTFLHAANTLDAKTPEYKQAEQGYLTAVDHNFELRDQLKSAGQKFAVRLELAPEEHSTVNFFAYEPMGEKLPAEVAKAKDWLQRMVPARNAPRIKHVEVHIDPGNERGSYSPAKERVQIDQNAKATTIIHEVGHRLEYENADWMKYDNDFHYSRTRRLGLKNLKDIYPNDGYREDEKTYEDDWQNRGGTAYSGKVYNDGATEILTTGLERMYADPLSFALQDPDFFAHVFKVLRE